MVQVLKSVWCYKNKMLPPTNLIESKLEDVIKICHIPKAGRLILEAKKENKQRICAICGKTFQVIQDLLRM